MRNWVVVCHGHVYGPFFSASEGRQWISRHYGTELLTNPEKFWVTRIVNPTRGIENGQTKAKTEGDASK